MLENEKTYWRGLDELEKTPEFVQNAKNEFPEYLASDNESGGTHRRDFLKLMGFGVAAASLAACETPVQKAIPYLIKPEEVDPTIPNWYASTYAEGGEYGSIIVKTREGRPIKIEGNNNSSISMGAQSAKIGASVLSLYDKARYRSPKIGGNNVSWDELDSTVGAKLSEIASSGKSIRIVTSTILSPSLNKVLGEFIAKYPTASVVTYDAYSGSAIIEANGKSFNNASLASYDFSKANVIVSFSADFLGTWLSPVEYIKQYSKGRKLSKDKKEMSKHYQFESLMSITGCSADVRTPLTPSEEALAIVSLYNLLAGKSGGATIGGSPLKEIKTLQKAADDLLANKGKSLVVSGSCDVNIQLVVNAINNLLGNYGSTISVETTSYYKKGRDSDFLKFVEEAKSGSVGAVLFLHTNPVYNHPLGDQLKGIISKIPVRIAFCKSPDETAELCEYVAPDHHYLESWADAQPKKGYYSLGQPTISPLFKTRQVLETFQVWSGGKADAYNYIKQYWNDTLYSQQNKFTSFQSFWDNSLRDGVFEVKGKEGSNGGGANFTFDVSSVSSAISSTYPANANEIEYILYEKVGLGCGAEANNPWLQELPDPVTRTSWDNYITISQKYAKEKNLEQGDYVKLDAKNGKSLVLPVFIQPGQAYNTVGIAVGYGRKISGKVGNNVGENAFPLIAVKDGALQYFGKCTLTRTEGNRAIAQIQTHHTIMGRPIIQETVLKEYQKDPDAGRYHPKVATNEGVVPASEISIWNTKGLKTHQYNNHFWGMVIDLNSCVGCGACVIGCQSENNVPVVGRQEVINRREMHWIRIDRYYSSDAEEGDLKAMENPAENPKVVFQPLMCQHCNNAPCETVCPVLATTHSTEGLNQMTYNRCIGTRYCANNCPYKVRRFNWFRYYENTKFDFYMNDDLGKMVLNPDVTVRARGVMEKCSMCIQRIQTGKLNAKLNSRRPIDGEIQTACAQACPADAIVFGDMNDEDSQIHKMIHEDNTERVYQVLEEINTRPSVSYLTKVRNS